MNNSASLRYCAHRILTTIFGKTPKPMQLEINCLFLSICCVFSYHHDLIERFSRQKQTEDPSVPLYKKPRNYSSSGSLLISSMIATTLFNSLSQGKMSVGFHPFYNGNIARINILHQRQIKINGVPCLPTRSTPSQ